MTTRKKAKPFVPAWTEQELEFVKASCKRGLKATEIADAFVKKFKTHSHPAVEHRVYKLRREGEAAPRRSHPVATDLKVLRGQGEGTGSSGSYVLTLPRGRTFIGTREQVLEMLSSTT